ncbi:MAG: hypothetical protein Q8Q14_04075 [Gemmatimonadales bacterium]|nr:hypothetical protein [Gemmatimonadales bacterium]
MRGLLVSLTTCAAVIAACGDAGSVDPDAIDTGEMTAVRRALDSALVDDTLYPTLSLAVFPYIDRASFIGTDSSRVVGIEFDTQATQGGDSVRADFTAVLGWRGYDANTRTVDSVFFILGAGRAPVDDSLRQTWSSDAAGTGTGYLVHQNVDSSVSVWRATGGNLRTTTSSYGAGRTQSGGGIELTIFRGTLSGEFGFAADSPTIVTAAKDFGSGARALKVRIRGSLP